MILYFDTRALIKLYVAEDGTDIVQTQSLVPAWSRHLE